MIVEYFLANKNYNVFELNEVLFAFKASYAELILYDRLYRMLVFELFFLLILTT